MGSHPCDDRKPGRRPPAPPHGTGDHQQAAVDAPCAVERRDGCRAILVRPREPFFQWLQETGGHSPTAIERRRARVDVVLVPHGHVRPGEGLRGPLLRAIAERHLADACPDRSRWPAFASLDALADWFACLDDVAVLDLTGE